MTIAGYNLGGDMDQCVAETDKAKFLAASKKLALQRNVSERTIILWCYNRSDSAETMKRIKNWLEEEDATQRWLMSLPTYEIEE